MAKKKDIITIKQLERELRKLRGMLAKAQKAGDKEAEALFLNDIRTYEQLLQSANGEIG